MAVKFIANLNIAEFRAYCPAYSENDWDCAGPAHPDEFTAWLDHYVTHRDNPSCPGHRHITVCRYSTTTDQISVQLSDHTAQVLCRTLQLPIPQGLEIKVENSTTIRSRVRQARTMSRKLCPTDLVQVCSGDENVMLQTPLDTIDVLCTLADRPGGYIAWHQHH